MLDDPRIRGVVNNDNKHRKYRPSLSCTGVALGAGFRIGSKVKYNGEIRYVYGIDNFYVKPNSFLSSNNIITKLNLGDVIVDHIEVELISL